MLIVDLKIPIIRNCRKLLLIDDRLAIPGVPDTNQRSVSQIMGSPTQTKPRLFAVGRAEAGVAFMAPCAIRCDRLAERERECKGTANF